MCLFSKTQYSKFKNGVLKKRNEVCSSQCLKFCIYTIHPSEENIMMNAPKMHVEHKAALFPKYGTTKNDANFETQAKSCVKIKVEKKF